MYLNESKGLYKGSTVSTDMAALKDQFPRTNN